MRKARGIAGLLVLAATAGAPGRARERSQDGCPTLALSADRTDATAGEKVTFTATLTDATGSEPPRYEWTSSEGSLVRVSDDVVRLDTTGCAEPVVTVSVVVGDRCRASRSARIEVFMCRLPPWRKLEDLYFPRGGATIAGKMNLILDDAAVRLERDPTLRLVVDGHADAGERPGIASRRAERARAYLVAARGIAPDRIVVRSFDDRCPVGDPAQNRRVALYLSPTNVGLDEIDQPCGPR